MPKINTSIQEGIEIEEGEKYVIINAEIIKTAIQGYEGCRVSFKSVDKKNTDLYTTMLWLREVAGTQSKIGAFIHAFEEYYENQKEDKDPTDTDNWINHKIWVKTWRNKKREIDVIG